jgi:aminomethyltransferase
MGEFIVRGKQATAFLQAATSNDVSKLKPGEIRCSCYAQQGRGIVDDLLVYRLDDDAEMTVDGEESYMLVVNASNEIKDWRWLKRISRGFDVKMQKYFLQNRPYRCTGTQSRGGIEKIDRY